MPKSWKSAPPFRSSTVSPWRIASVETTIVVTDSGTLIDPHSTGEQSIASAPRRTARPRRRGLPGRSVMDLVNAQPGWLLEANAVLHPRGSEYQAQYVVNGIPMTDNRSPSFAPEIDADDVQSMNILTAGIPAEYGRKLGGVIEVTTARDSRQGWHGKVSVTGGSFDTAGRICHGAVRVGPQYPEPQRRCGPDRSVPGPAGGAELHQFGDYRQLLGALRKGSQRQRPAGRSASPRTIAIPGAQ